MAASAARANLAQADLALTRPQLAARRLVELGKQGGAAVVVYFQRCGGTAGGADREGGDVFPQLGDGLAAPDQDGLLQPAILARVDADAGHGELGRGLLHHLGAFDFRGFVGQMGSCLWRSGP